MRIIKNKRGATSLAVALLVIATLIFSIAALVILSNKSNTVEDQFHTAYSIEDVYVLEEQIRFYLANGGELDKVKELFEAQTPVSITGSTANHKSLIIGVEGNSVSVTEYAENMIIRYKFEV